MNRFVVFLALVFACLLGISVNAADEPRLIIDPRGPSGIVSELLFTPDGDTLISLGHDKAIRFWNVETGELRKTLRLEIGDGGKGKLYAGAISADGRWLAVGGYSSASGIRLIDLEVNEVVAVLSCNRSVNTIAFSDCGRWLASSSLVDYAVLLWDLDKKMESQENGDRIEIDPSQKLVGHTAKIESVAFAPGGDQLVSGSHDHSMILWNRDSNGDFAPAETMEKHESEIYALAYSPDGKFIVSGGKDHQLLLWDGKTGRFIRAIDTDMGFEVTVVAISPDSSSVMASSSPVGSTAIYGMGEDNKRVLLFDRHSNRTTAVEWNPLRDIIASAGGDDHDIYLWRPESGEVIHHLHGDGKAVWAVAFAEEEIEVAFGQVPDKALAMLETPLRKTFNFSSLAFNDIPDGERSDPPGFRRIISQDGTQKLKYIDRFHLQTSSGKIEHKSTSNDWIFGYSLTPDGNVAVGSAFNVRLWTPDGVKVRSFVGHEGFVWSVSPSPDNRFLSTASYDQTVRLWNQQTGTLLVSLFPSSDGEWVCWTPDGYFAASPDGGKYIAWHFNKGTDKVAGYLSGAQLYEHFYRPDIVKRSIAENRASSEIVAELGLKFDLETALRGAPSVAISEPAPNITSPNRRQHVLVEGIDNGGGVAEVQLFNADKRIRPDGPGSFRGGKWLVPFTVSLAPGENEIRAVSVNAEGIESAPETIKVNFVGETATSRLHLVAVGLNEYKNPRFSLDYCRPDVDAFATAFVEGSAVLFSEVFVHKLFDVEATRPAIEAKFTEIASQATPEDVFVFVFAGHGVMSEGSEGVSTEFHLVPYDVTQLYGNDEALAELALSASKLEELAAAIPARKQLMVLDSCQSGGLVDTFALRGVAEQKAIAQLSRATGMHVLASTRTEQFSTEAKVLGHGLFTYALLEALRGRGDGNGDGRITVKEVEAFINTRVPELSEKHTGTAQYPNSFGRGQDFPIGIVE